MLTDAHTHILPDMDDGSESVEMSMQMLAQLHAQGAECVVATPHFYLHREKRAADYLQRRQARFDTLLKQQPPVELLLGAEVAIEQGISDVPELAQLAVSGTDLILLELPYAPYQSWMEAEIHAIAVQHGLTPVIAHIHRYLMWYTEEEFNTVLGWDAIFQINVEAFEGFRQNRIAREVFKRKLPFLFGSDCHNLSDRKPNFDLLRRKLKSEVLDPANRVFRQHRKG